MAEFSKSDRADEVETVKLLELLYGRHFRVVFIGSALLALQQLSGINVVFYFYSNIFKSSGVPSDIANMSVGVVNLSVAGSTLVSGSSVVYLSIGGVLLFVLSFSMGVGPVINFFVGLLYLRLLEQLGPRFCTVFASFCLLGFFFVKNNVVETKGKTLQEIEMALLPA
ncbi:hypothetical protein L6452_42606 [Arctium lappa]|uniref:Uncharacterized protein n=2 Tax=Arctium lappa TaxID=4217 RepID=A0ACB8XJW5_ARCLA|nr:hypothetical protein L6452_42597 [Arctium lappa]KAI3667541.1 hypothetical protein L6452_42606 [Arctium lappa]